MRGKKHTKAQESLKTHKKKKLEKQVERRDCEKNAYAQKSLIKMCKRTQQKKTSSS